MLLCSRIDVPRGGNEGLSVSQLLPADKNTGDTVVGFCLDFCCSVVAQQLYFVAVCSLSTLLIFVLWLQNCCWLQTEPSGQGGRAWTSSLVRLREAAE